MMTPHIQLLLVAVAGWVNREKQDVIEYLWAENRVLREHVGAGGVRFTEDQRRRLAVAAKRVGCGKLFGVEPVVTADTLLRWSRRLVVRKYDGSQARGSGRPRVAIEIQDLVVHMAVENPGATQGLGVCSVQSEARDFSKHDDGFLRSLLALLNLDNEVPDHTTIWRRKAKLGKVTFYENEHKAPVHILIDSSGLAVKFRP